MPKKISGFNIVGVTDGVDPIQNIISQIQSGFTGGYQSGQALGMKLLPKQQKTLSSKTDVGIEKLTTQLNTLDREETGIRSRIKDLEKNITDLENKKEIPDIPEVFAPEYRGHNILGYPKKNVSSEKLRQQRITELAKSSYAVPVPESRIISELEKNKNINIQIKTIKKQVNDLTIKELKKIQGQKNFVKQRLGLLQKSNGSKAALSLDNIFAE